MTDDTTERYPLAEWMEDGDGWEAVPDESPLYEFVAKAAGCGGRVFANPRIPELVMCDGADLVLWKIGDVRGEALKRDVSLALSVAEMAAAFTTKAVAKEREECAKIADKHRKLWQDSDTGAGPAAALGIANEIRKRSESERGGDVDAGSGADRPSQAPPEEDAHEQ